MPADNLRFGATTAEARMNWLWKFEFLCAAELSLETAAAPSRWVVVGNAGESAVEQRSDRKVKKKSCIQKIVLPLRKLKLIDLI
jgi:hypothetical protein